MAFAHCLIYVVTQEVPNFFHAVSEVGVSHASEIARPRHINRHNAFHHARRGAQYSDAIAEHHGFFDIMGNQDHRLFVPLPNAQQLLPQ